MMLLPLCKSFQNVHHLLVCISLMEKQRFAQLTCQHHLLLKHFYLCFWRWKVPIKVQTTFSYCNTFCAPRNEMLRILIEKLSHKMILSHFCYFPTLLLLLFHCKSPHPKTWHHVDECLRWSRGCPGTASWVWGPPWWSGGWSLSPWSWSPQPPLPAGLPGPGPERTSCWSSLPQCPQWYSWTTYPSYWLACWSSDKTKLLFWFIQFSFITWESDERSIFLVSPGPGPIIFVAIPNDAGFWKIKISIENISQSREC